MACAFCAFLCFSLQDAVMSVTMRTHPALQMIWLNSVVVLTFLLGVIFWRKGWVGLVAVMHTHQLKLHLVRAVLLAAGIVLALTAVSKLPLPNFYMVIFMSPLLAISLSGIILKEPVGWRKALCIFSGFAGLAYALRPDASGFNHDSLYALAAAILFSITALMTRFLGRKDSVSVLVFYPQILLIVLFALPAAFVYRELAIADIGLVLLTGVFSTLAFVINATAYRLAPVYLVLPFQFLQFLWGTLAEAFLHGTHPEKQIVFGAVMIIFSNLLMIYWQHRAEKKDTHAN